MLAIGIPCALLVGKARLLHASYTPLTRLLHASAIGIPCALLVGKARLLHASAIGIPCALLVVVVAGESMLCFLRINLIEDN